MVIRFDSAKFVADSKTVRFPVGMAASRTVRFDEERFLSNGRTLQFPFSASVAEHKSLSVLRTAMRVRTDGGAETYMTTSPLLDALDILIKAVGGTETLMLYASGMLLSSRNNIEVGLLTEVLDEMTAGLKIRSGIEDIRVTISAVDDNNGRTGFVLRAVDSAGADRWVPMTIGYIDNEQLKDLDPDTMPTNTLIID